jgi:hypothetical protein
VRYALKVSMSSAMTALMVAMMVLMVGAMFWGALAARGSRLWRTVRRRPSRNAR